MVSENLLGTLPPSNVPLTLNLIDYLAQDDDLLTIRSQSIAPRPLDYVEEHTRPWIKYTMMLFSTLLVIVFGMARLEGTSCSAPPLTPSRRFNL